MCTQNVLRAVLNPYFCTDNTGSSKGSSIPQDLSNNKTSTTAGKKKAAVPEMDSSAVTLGDAKINARRDLHSGQVMITDAISDVRVKYHIIPKEIGHGHYGVVRKCMDRETKVWYAIKSIRKSKVGKVDVLKREITLLKEVHHPNIIELVEVHEDQKYLHLITELCTGGELFDRIIEKTQSKEGHFSEKDAANLVKCILDAIAYCHDVKGIVSDVFVVWNAPVYNITPLFTQISPITLGTPRFEAREFSLLHQERRCSY